MSLMSMASPYSSGDNIHGKKNGKRISTLRGTGSKVYPKPETEPDFTENSNILDESMLYEKNFTNDMKISGSYFPSLDRESMENRDKVDAVPMNSFYNTTSNQQKQLSSALNKLMGGGVGGGQEGMSNFNADLNVLDSKLSGEDIANPLQKDFVKNTGILSAGSSFGHGRNGTGGGVIPTTPLDPMPMEYLRNSGYGGVKPYTDYESGYSTGVIPSHLANYSYPGMAGNLMPKEVEVTQDNNVLLEKISYMIYLLEQQKQEKKKNTTEEFVLYSFLGVFMIYVVDSFSRSGRYIR